MDRRILLLLNLHLKDFLFMHQGVVESRSHSLCQRDSRSSIFGGLVILLLNLITSVVGQVSQPIELSITGRGGSSIH